MTQCYFIAGTDTDVGKTYCSSLLLRAAQDLGLASLPYKPVAAGCELSAGELKNQDALTLMDASHCLLPYSAVNPYAFEPPIAPHIAAAQLGLALELNIIQQGFEALLQRQADLLLIEGAGGWHLPLSLPTKNQAALFLSDWVAMQQLPVILVVGMKLGCLNHAMLTLEAIKAAGVPLAGWVANQCEPTMVCYEENLQSLKQLIAAPLLAEIQYGQQSPEVFYSLLEKIKRS